MKVSRVRGGAVADYYSTGDSITYFSMSGHRVTGLGGDWVTGYRFISFRDTVYRDFWYWDKFTDQRFHPHVIRAHMVQVQVH